jgi:hypothetical protein
MFSLAEIIFLKICWFEYYLYICINLITMTQKYLTFKWSTSRGQNTYGYTICSLYVDGKKVSSCNGGGYDMRGTCFGSWLEKEFSEGIKNLDMSQFYGMREYEGKRYLDGACGLDSMRAIAKALGYRFRYIQHLSNKKADTYIFENVD